MSRRNPQLLVEDMIESSKRIFQYTEGLSFELFSTDIKTIDAVIRNFEIIGEAANRLPENFKSQYSQIDWQKIRGLRNRIVHDYMGIDYTIIWEIKENYLPGLLTDLSDIKF